MMVLLREPAACGVIFHRRLIQPYDPRAHRAKIVIGALLILVLERDKRDRIRAYAALAPIVVLGLIGYTILFML